MAISTSAVAGAVRNQSQPNHSCAKSSLSRRPQASSQQATAGTVSTCQRSTDAVAIAVVTSEQLWPALWHDSSAWSARMGERLEHVYRLGLPVFSPEAHDNAVAALPAERPSSSDVNSAGQQPTSWQVQTNEPSTSAVPDAPSRSSSRGSGGPSNNNNGKDQDFYVNAGVAIRTLREDIPCLFQQDLDYDIYREDIVFRDPRNVFKGMRNYKTIFWSLRFHGRIFFRLLYVEILTIWQPEDKQIKMRWKVHGIPRVPWEAEGQFDGISTFRLDSHGKIYEHQVDNVIFRDNPPLRLPLFARVPLVPGAVSGGGAPCPGACVRNQPGSTWWHSSFSWYRLYVAMLLSLAATSSNAATDSSNSPA